MSDRHRTFAKPDLIRLIVFDVDGVLTDGRIVIDDDGRETKAFHVRDGLAMKAWLRLGYHIAIITGRTSGVVARRAEELGIEQVVQGSIDKVGDLRRIADLAGVPLEQTAAMGDDLPDLAMLQVAGYPIAVADAAKEVRDVAAFVTTRRGGDSAAREAIEHLLAARGAWAEVVSRYDVNVPDTSSRSRGKP